MKKTFILFVTTFGIEKAFSSFYKLDIELCPLTSMAACENFSSKTHHFSYPFKKLTVCHIVYTNTT